MAELTKVQRTRKARDEKITMLYEEYIHFEKVKSTWTKSVTVKPKVEPCFRAGMQGVELAFVLLAHFISDSREYVVLRPRIEMVAEDIRAQFKLVAEIVDAELEDDNVNEAVLGSLTQSFPFEGAPPVTGDKDVLKARQSTGLEILINTVRDTLPLLSDIEKQSLRKIIRNITGTFQTCFSEWTVGVGMEEQLSELRDFVNLPPMTQPFNRKYLNYSKLVQPQVMSETLTKVDYKHKEDFFFRSVHLGTECWCFVAFERLQSALSQISEFGHWDNAAAHVRSAAHIFDYLGSHVMMLTSMVLRDYLILKVEIEGTSGAGSLAVKLLRKTTTTLIDPLIKSVVGENPMPNEEGLRSLLLDLYANPERSPGRYNYAKSLEAVESGLLGGFFYRHFCLASNVIGSDAKGTMNMGVQMLKKTYETPLFPLLDFVRSELGRVTDEQLKHRKGKIMGEIEKNRNARNQKGVIKKALGSIRLSSRIFHKRSSLSKSGAELERVTSTTSSDGSGSLSGLDKTEIARRTLYSTKKVPEIFQQAAEAQQTDPRKSIAFLDHAFGKVAPEAGVAMAKKVYGLFQLGNQYWGILYGKIIPEAASHIRNVLDIDASCEVEFGHNSHELFTKLMSIKIERILSGDAEKLRILTTDTEFYSLTRQLNRFAHLDCIEVVTIPAEPAATLADRFVDAAGEDGNFDFAMASQCTYLTQATLIRDVPDFMKRMRDALPLVEEPTSMEANPIIIVDGYHSFGAIPTSLGKMQPGCFFLSGVLKHVGSGANCGFIVAPPGAELRPMLTGWLADPTVLGPESEGVVFGSKVGFTPGQALQGSTPAFGTALILFNEVMRRWNDNALTVHSAHAHVMQLQEFFLQNLPEEGVVSHANLVDLSPEECRSHTISFNLKSPQATKVVVEAMFDEFAIEVDARRGFLRIGFGFNHSLDDVVKLIDAIQSVNKAL